ncbi:SulP family inorganic anion transporter [Spongisporangium articulatum]|uniref:SulP family inorganic anion transporter n=1 Tax=Spongisporangium articulatum TaxID=3362603 RepID=A0ABW8ATU0_9ACTN
MSLLSEYPAALLRREFFAGLVVALALIPEAISFSIIAGLDPKVGLFASATMAVTIAFTGGRPAMISAATGSVALVLAPLSHAHGLPYVVAAVVLGGLIQVGLALAGIAALMRYIPRSVMVGFVNSLAILIFHAQLVHLVDVPWAVYPLLALGLLIMVGLPRLSPAVPAPLVAIGVVTAIAWGLHVAVPTVGDEGALPTSLPVPGLPDVPFTLDSLRLVLPTAVAVALVGLLESLLTAKLVDDVTETRSDKTRESWGQGVANVVTGFFGGMGGCAMIGQTMINVKVSGARTRLSTFLAGALLLALVLPAGPLVSRIPMAALVAVMVLVSVATFDWHSVAPATLRRMPRSETSVMVVTVAVVLATSNLAYGVIAGVLVASVLFARRVAHLVEVVPSAVEDGTRRYAVRGQVFFASSNDLVEQFDYAGDPACVVVDFSGAHVWDASSVAAMDAVAARYARHGTTVEFVGLNDDSARRHERLAGQLNVS